MNEANNNVNEANDNVNEAKVNVRILGYFIAALPLLIAAIVWSVLLAINFNYAAERSLDNFSVSTGEITITQNDSLSSLDIEFDVTVKNNSKHAANEIQILLSFYDGDSKIASLETETDYIISSGATKTSHVYIGKYGVTKQLYTKLIDCDLSKITVRPEVTYVYFTGESSTDGTLSLVICIAFALFSIIAVAAWIFNVFFYTHCENCKNVFALVKIKSSEPNSNKAIWNAQSSVVDEYEHKYVCKYCGNVSKKFDPDKS